MMYKDHEENSYSLTEREVKLQGAGWLRIAPEGNITLAPQ